MSNNKLKGVVIGAGYFAPFQLKAWKRIPEVSIGAVCDRDRGRAEIAATRFDIPRWYDDYRTLIDREKPDFVDVITPPDTHLAVCKYAASHRAAVICQKPLAPTFEQAQQLVNAMRKAGVRFMVHENWRWQPWYRQIKSIQQRGSIGEFIHFYFRMRTGDGWGENAYLERQPYFRDYPRLLIYETGVHFIDMFRFFFGEVRSVYTHMRRINPVIRGEDVAQVFLSFKNGPTALLDANRYNEAVETPDPRLTFGELRIDATGGHLEMDGCSRIRIKPLGKTMYDHPYAHESLNFAGESCYFLQRHFVECMKTGREFESEGMDYLRTLRVVEACYSSASEQRVVELGT